MRLQGWEWIIILVIVMLLWGAPKLPGLAKSLGQSLKIFKKEMKNEEPKKTEDKNPEDKPVASSDKPADN
jgi:sec-independent protein translocase protein TatA